MKKKKTTPKPTIPTPEVFRVELASADSTGKIIWRVYNIKTMTEEIIYVDAMYVDEILRTNRHRPKDAYNKSKKWKRKLD